MLPVKNGTLLDPWRVFKPNFQLGNGFVLPGDRFF